MNHDEKDLIQGLFGRLGEAERTAPPRDPEAERFIRDRVAAQPGAPYYMAQTIIVQEKALEAAQARIAELEGRGSPAAGQSPGGLLGNLFGTGQASSGPMGMPQGYARSAAQAEAPAGPPWNSSRSSVPSAGSARSRGGGFLAGAAQTAVGVAGGMMLGSMLGSMLSGGDEANAAETPVDDTSMDPGADDFGGMDDGFGDFDF